MEGYAKLYRALMDNNLWTSEPFTRGQAWVDLILLANYKDNTLFLRGVEVHIKRGSLAYSQSTLASRWKWSRKKVSTFLKYLKTEQQIEHQNNNVTTLIHIVNYEKYQGGEPQIDLQKNRRRTAEEPQKNTNNNRKRPANDNPQQHP